MRLAGGLSVGWSLVAASVVRISHRRLWLWLVVTILTSTVPSTISSTRSNGGIHCPVSSLERVGGGRTCCGVRGGRWRLHGRYWLTWGRLGGEGSWSWSWSGMVGRHCRGHHLTSRVSRGGAGLARHAGVEVAKVWFHGRSPGRGRGLREGMSGAVAATTDIPCRLLGSSPGSLDRSWTDQRLLESLLQLGELLISRHGVLREVGHGRG